MAVKCFFDWSYIRFRVLRVGNKSHGHLTCYGVVVVFDFNFFVYLCDVYGTRHILFAKIFSDVMSQRMFQPKQILFQKKYTPKFRSSILLSLGFLNFKMIFCCQCETNPNIRQTLNLMGIRYCTMICCRAGPSYFVA